MIHKNSQPASCNIGTNLPESYKALGFTDTKSKKGRSQIDQDKSDLFG